MVTSFKRTLCLVVVLAFVLSAFSGISLANAGPEVKNVIIMVPDGTGVTHTTAARWYQGGKPLAMDEMAAGLVRCYSAESAITDSAPAATAMATGYKSNSKFISVMPIKITSPGVPPVNGADKFKPLATVLEGAKLSGMSTGLVATSNIQHATPAAFSAHTPNRSDYETIAEQQVYEGIDVVLGGGSKYLIPSTNGGTRKDGENLVDELKKMGYEFVENRDQMMKTDNSKLWGLFAADDMNYDMDRNPEKQPSLAEMTQKAIEILSKNNKGFFLHVEGSKVDWASHANDPVGVISDVLAFDQAVKVALDFAKKDGHTLVLVASDHGNGGMSIGNKETDSSYDKTDISRYIVPLKKATLTGEGIESKLNSERTNVVEVMSKYYSITDLTTDEIQAIKNAKPGSLNYVVGPMISKRAAIGWTTTGHTGEDTVLYSYGPGRPTGVIENTDFAKITAKALDIDLADLNNKLYVEAVKAFEAKNATVKLNQTDPANPVFEVVKGDTKLELPVNKNIVKVNGKTRAMKGLTVIPDKVVFVPREAVNLIK